MPVIGIGAPNSSGASADLAGAVDDLAAAPRRHAPQVEQALVPAPVPMSISAVRDALVASVTWSPPVSR
jgi:hypothetical protein